jgi:hypothetical protein
MGFELFRDPAAFRAIAACSNAVSARWSSGRHGWMTRAHQCTDSDCLRVIRPYLDRMTQRTIRDAIAGLRFSGGATCDRILHSRVV